MNHDLRDAMAAASTTPRRMPSLPKLAKALHLGDVPACYRCGAEVPRANWATATGQLDRAHVIDRCFGGSDDAANLRPLCETCHEIQPSFVPGEEAVALYWFTGNPARGGSLIRQYTNDFGERMVFVHNGRMGLVFHGDDLMPGGPLIVEGPESVRPLPGLGGSLVNGFLLSRREAGWLSRSIAEARKHYACLGISDDGE
jgi:hypothetical protein